ncbi:MAG: hypothetical protein KAY44_03590 [Neisseria sp.]|nr:hypothetical protein [Neisseria sp.]
MRSDILIKSIKFNKFMRFSGGFSDGRRWMQMNKKVSVGTISFVKTKRNRTHGAQRPSETSFSDGLDVLCECGFSCVRLRRKKRGVRTYGAFRRPLFAMRTITPQKRG